MNDNEKLIADDGRDEEMSCSECGSRNPVWWAVNGAWNLAVGGDASREAGGMLCPTCFHRRWLTATGSVVPEPSGGLCLECGTQCAVPEHDAPEPQGEPSDAPTVQLAARKGGKSRALIDQLLSQSNEHGIHVEVTYPQGEPSDTQEIEFPFTHEGVTLEQDDGGVWVSDGGGSSYWISPRVLAALRAASEAGGEGR